jgi:hypothetical protein
MEKLTASVENIEHRSYLGRAYLVLAGSQRARGLASDALQTVNRAIATLERVLIKDAALAEARAMLRNAHQERAANLAGFDLAAAEVKHGQRALSLAHSGKFGAALKEAETLAAQKDLSAEGCYNLGRVFGLLTAARKKGDVKGQDRDAARAMEMLRRAKATSYFQDPECRERLRREPDLAALRDRDEFQKLSDTRK